MGIVLLDIIRPHHRHITSMAIDVYVQLPKPRSFCCCFGLTKILYGNGFCSLVNIGGIWSLSWLTIATIFIAAFCKDDSIACRTLIFSRYHVSQRYTRAERHSPVSVRGLATTTCTTHSSQQTSSSNWAAPPRRPNQPDVIPVFLLFRSKN